MADNSTEINGTEAEPSIRDMLEKEFEKSEQPSTDTGGSDKGSTASGTDTAASDGTAPSTIETADEAEARKRGNPYKDPVTGKFTSKSTEAAPVQAAPDKPISAPDSKPATEAAPSTAPANAPPVSWAPDAKAEWAKLSPAIQAAVLKRETEASNGFRHYSEQTRRYEQILSPVEQEAKRLGMDVPSALNALMGAHHALTRNPAQAIAKLAQDFGVEIQITGQAQTAPAQIPSSQSDPRVDAIWQNLQDTQAREAANMDYLVQEFSTTHEHFGEVQVELMAMIPAIKQSKPYGSPTEWLQEAYDRAVWANPNTRARLSQAEQARADAKRVAEAKAKVGQARLAGSSVTGSTGSPAAPVAGTVREALEQAWGNA